MKIVLIYMCLLGVVVVKTLDNDVKRDLPKSKCDTCIEIAQNFIKGVERTKNDNFGGGNTEWEESRLGQFSNSIIWINCYGTARFGKERCCSEDVVFVLLRHETRLVDILETVCKDASKECPMLLEAHEEHVEAFWFHSRMTRDTATLHHYLCIERAKVCCPNNTYGPVCMECLGGLERPCTDNGKCDGSGTREGSGKCMCDDGYRGKLCDSCVDGYYLAEINDTYVSCKVCHMACMKLCSGGGPSNCDACKVGWVLDGQLGCQDVDECLDKPCKEEEYCTDTPGSFSCLNCSTSCSSCTGPGADRCVQCADGFRREGDVCLDIDECDDDGDEPACPPVGQTCVNSPGSFKCICDSGYVIDGDGCRPKSQEYSNGRHGVYHQGWRLTEPEMRLLSGLIGLISLSVFFLVFGKFVSFIHPYLICIPVGILSIVLYYVVSGQDNLQLADDESSASVAASGLKEGLEESWSSRTTSETSPKGKPTSGKFSNEL